jgi:23S rRNA (cytosine1962-C5)-methyltransferase
MLAASDTTAMRLVHAEGDDLSGLVVDRYGDLIVVEIGSAGLESMRETVLDVLRESCSPRLIFLKNNLPHRKLEGLSLTDEWLGEGERRTIVTENGLRFLIDPSHSQKTGFFLDQRDNRALIRDLARERSVLNLFAFSGAFGVYAMHGGARSVEEVDISAPAIAAARENHSLNASEGEVRYTTADVFDYSRELVRQKASFDLIICDPPAFAKTRGEVDRAARGYKDINMQALKVAAPGAFLATFSCSGHISVDLFQKIVFSAALDARRSVSFVRRLTAGTDHPVSIYCPEGEYLKGLLLRVND